VSIRTNTGVAVKGADAIAYLRQQFENAGGTAASFRDKMLDTFAGQKQLLRGSFEKLAIVLGEPFAQPRELTTATSLGVVRADFAYDYDATRALVAGLAHLHAPAEAAQNSSAPMPFCPPPMRPRCTR